LHQTSRQTRSNLRRLIAALALAAVLGLGSPGSLAADESGPWRCVPWVRPVPTEAAQVARYEPAARGVGRELEVPADLIARVIYVESRGDPRAVSPAGAYGLMQIMGFHWRSGEDPFDPAQNIRRGTSILRDNYERLGGDWVRATRAYAGSGPVAEEYVHLVFGFDCTSAIVSGESHSLRPE
jgi:soluble lytic murein transglycosylase-like protein